MSDFEYSKDLINKLKLFETQFAEYESPIQIVMGEFQTSVEDNCVKAVQNYGFNINKEELRKALQYDRHQYDKGYEDARRRFERPQGEWISVSERLPDDMQRVLIWFEYYRYGDFNCMYQTYGFGYMCDGKWSSFINGETGWQDYNIIAWQPLPEPYKEGGKDGVEDADQ